MNRVASVPCSRLTFIGSSQLAERFRDCLQLPKAGWSQLDDVEHVLDGLDARSIDLLLVDASVPETDQLRLCQALREINPDSAQLLPLLWVAEAELPRLSQPTLSGGLGWVSLSSDVASIRAQLDLARRCVTAFHEVAARYDSALRAQHIAALGHYTIDWTNRSLSLSKQAQEVIGHREQGDLRSVDSLMLQIHPQDRDAVHADLFECAEQGEPFRREHRVVCDDGSVRYVHHMVVRQPDGEGFGVRLFGVIQEVTGQRTVEMLSQRLGKVLDNALNEIYVFDAHTLRFVQLNARALRNLGYSLADIEQLRPMDLCPDLDLAEFEALVTPLRDGSCDQVALETRHRRRDGSEYPVEVHLQLSHDEQAPVFVGIGMDITERQAARDALNLSEQRYRTVFQSTGTAVAVLNADGWFELVNDELERMVRLPADELVGKRRFAEFIDPKAREATLEYIERRLDEAALEAAGRHEFRYANARGHAGWGLLTVAPLPGSDSLVISIVDISELKRTQASLQHLASHDVLTGLPNRMLFRDRLRRAMRDSNRSPCLATVMLIDLDRFKNINDTLGHHWGDELLRAVADRITACVRETDTVARLGGDEFGIVLHSVVHQRDAGRVAGKILQALRAPVELQGHRLFVTASIGIAIYPNDGDTVDELLVEADVAMYQAKDTGKNNYQYYSRELNRNAQDQLDLESSLRYAMERKEFSLVYQPQIDLRNGKLCGVEALLRWQHGGRGMVPPDRFVPLLEETGLIVSVGEWVLKQACQQCRRWLDEGFADMSVSVNLSARQVAAGLLPDTVARALQEANLPAECLELELTESLLMQDVENTRKVLDEISRMGVRLSIDDFGTGYSSLAYLKRLPVQSLKIDRSFVMDMINDRDDLVIVQSTVDLGHNLGLEVVAEGVENQESLDQLQQLGCDYAQGYHLSRPLPVAELTDWLQREFPGPDSRACNES